MSRRADRVLILSTSYPSTDRDPSGHFVESHARALAARGADVTLLVPGPLAECARIEDGLSVHRLGGTRLFGWPGAPTKVRQNPLLGFASLPFALRVRERARALGRFDRIVAHWMVPTALPLFTFAEAGSGAFGGAELEVVAHGADVRLLAALPPALRSRVAERLLHRASSFTFVAHTLRETFLRSLPAPLGRRIANRSRVEACPIAVPPRAHLEDPRPLSRKGVPYAVWVGRDVPAKRLDLAISAAALARMKLVVVGPPNPMASVASALDELVTYVGARPREETLAWIAHASVLLSTSRDEAAPTAAREARALGVPVLACKAGDLAEWSRTDAGISLVEPEVAAIARALAPGAMP